MDFEQKIKRLAVILALSLIVIFAAKWMLSKAVTNLGKAAAEKKQQDAVSRTVPAPAADEAPSPVTAGPASAVPEEESAPASAVAETAVTR